MSATKAAKDELGRAMISVTSADARPVAIARFIVESMAKPKDATDPTEFRVAFVDRGDGLVSAYCSCGAPIRGQLCPHRMAIVQRDEARILGAGDLRADPRPGPYSKENIQKSLAAVASWLPGSNLELPISKLKAVEARPGR